MAGKPPSTCALCSKGLQPGGPRVRVVEHTTSWGGDGSRVKALFHPACWSHVAAAVEALVAEAGRQ